MVAHINLTQHNMESSCPTCFFFEEFAWKIFVMDYHEGIDSIQGPWLAGSHRDFQRDEEESFIIFDISQQSSIKKNELPTWDLIATQKWNNYHNQLKQEWEGVETISTVPSLYILILYIFII